VGSIVYVQPTAPVCCCPPAYNPAELKGSFMCPLSAKGNGPYASKFTSLLDVITRDTLIEAYPYCKSDLNGPDRVMCSMYDPENMAFYTNDCPPVFQGSVFNTETNTTVLIPNSFQSGQLIGNNYQGVCPYYANCAVTSSSGRCWNIDNPFTFIGRVGVVTAIDIFHIIPIVSVSFNGGRTSYDFLQTDLKLNEFKPMYELWWVLRTGSEFIVKKRKAFTVAYPLCTFDTGLNQYFPYVEMNPDGTFVT
jgi:hypothetical protein